MAGRETAREEVARWVEAHRALLRVAKERSELEGREGSALLRALRARVHVHLGYGSFIEYAGRLFGYAARTVHDKLRTAEALEKLPQLARALMQGEATWSAARELARVATVETEGEWLEAAKGRTVREIEQLVAGHEPGSRPNDPVGSASQRHVLRFEVAAETLATFRQALKALRQRSGGHVDDDTALLLMARQVLSNADAGRSEADHDHHDHDHADHDHDHSDTTRSSGSSDAGADAASPRASDAGRASYQLALTLCERCQRGFQEADGERLEVDPAIVEMARCDATLIAHVGRALSEKTNSVHAHVCRPPCEVSNSVHADAEGSPPPEIGLAAHVGVAQPHSRRRVPSLSPVGPPPASPQRATQTIPPALRRHVHARDAGRCVVPGCRHTTFVDLHHVKPRAEGGLHDADNLAVLCGAHHRAVHQGALRVTGSVSAGLRFRHADGTPYGDAPASQLMATLDKVFRALRGLGFKERDARQALDAVTAAGTPGRASPTAEELLRAALQKLAPPMTPQHRARRAV